MAYFKIHTPDGVVSYYDKDYNPYKDFEYTSGMKVWSKYLEYLKDLKEFEKLKNTDWNYEQKQDSVKFSHRCLLVNALRYLCGRNIYYIDPNYNYLYKYWITMWDNAHKIYENTLKITVLRERDLRYQHKRFEIPVYNLVDENRNPIMNKINELLDKMEIQYKSSPKKWEKKVEEFNKIQKRK